MSGHSKWKKIKRQKGAADIKKGNAFTKLSQEITLAVREGGGGDPDLNFMLRMAIDKAKEGNMPKDTIERAIDKGLGKSDKGSIEEITYELVGSNGTAVLVDCLTDNRNRTINHIRDISSHYGFSIGSGGIMWQFQILGRIAVKPLIVNKVHLKGKEVEKLEKVDKEKIILLIMDMKGVKDIKEKDDEIIVITEKNSFKTVLEKIKGEKIKISKANIVKLSKTKVKADKNLLKIDNMIKEIEELDDVTGVWDNIKRE